ncbi:hypothetical protein AA18889_1054 [Acetobacter senegalensis DSM 18889]|nr:hypothetical protein AA18889_1054 [Acetobacter senegalensis DSM 18889]
MPLRRWTRGARLAYAMRNPLGGFARVPAAPAVALRDLWSGNAAGGEQLVRNQTLFEGTQRPLIEGEWDNPQWPEAYRRWLQGFTWLQDLRELGAESARIKARTLVAQWMEQTPAERPISDPSITGARLAAWLGCYEFFAASADDSFRQQLMASLIMEARSIMALMPEEAKGWRALTALKGLLAVAVSLPDYPEFLTRYLRLIDSTISQQILPDGGHITRCPEDLLQCVRELAEMLYILQVARVPLPTSVLDAANRSAPALRAMRHGDGGLALFNGSCEQNPQFIEHVLSRASRTRVVAAGLPESGFARLNNGRALLIADAASAAPAGYDGSAHAGMLSFEFSSGRQRLIVNCGSSIQRGWAEALRYPAAHSVLELADLTPMRFDANGGISQKPQVTRQTSVQDGVHCLSMTHDGYKPQGGGLYSRKIYLDKDGTVLQGIEKLEDVSIPVPLCIRFHLHPDVSIEQEEDGYLLHTPEETWFFWSDAHIEIEESVYLGQGKCEATRQFVLTPAQPDQNDEDVHSSPESEPEEDTEFATPPDMPEEQMPVVPEVGSGLLADPSTPEAHGLENTLLPPPPVPQAPSKPPIRWSLSLKNA